MTTPGRSRPETEVIVECGVEPDPRLKLERRTRFGGRRSGSERDPGPVVLKRYVTLFLIAITLGGVAWAATLLVTHPAQSRPQTRFEIPVGTPRAAAESVIDYDRLDARLNRLMQDPAMVALAVGVVENGQIRFVKGYGETVAGSGDPVTPQTVFRWASLSKGVAADLVALLAHEGRLSLNDPVGRRAPSLRLPGGNERLANVGDLLAHQLGLFAHAEDSKLEDGVDPRWLRGNLATLHNICPPGSCHAYQNVAYDAASEVVERATGQPYGAVARERLFAPLGMTTASVGREGLFRARSWAPPHIGLANPRPVEITDAYYRVPAAGGVNGSITDLAIWMLAQMGEAPDVMPPQVLGAVQAPRVATPGENARRRKYHERTPTSAYGLGWRMFDYSGRRVIGHHGGVRGYHSVILFDPRLRTGIVLLWTGSSPKPNGLEYEVMDMAYRLPFRDWMEIDSRSRDAQPERGDRPENEGGTG